MVLPIENILYDAPGSPDLGLSDTYAKNGLNAGAGGAFPIFRYFPEKRQSILNPEGMVHHGRKEKLFQPVGRPPGQKNGK
jgi:hypothetical protein